MFPSWKQWKKWSLPSKLTAIGAYVSIISLILAIIFFIIPDAQQEENLGKKEREIPIINMLVKNEHRNYNEGTDVFGIKWEKDYSSHIIEIKNISKRKSIKQLSLILEFKAASIIYRNVILASGSKGIEPGKNITGELQVTGPLFIGKKPETKVIPMQPANIFNATIEEIFPEGSVTFRVILNKNEPQEMFVKAQYYYEAGKELKLKVFEGNWPKDQKFVKFPALK